MINFDRLHLSDKAILDEYLMKSQEKGCEYSFANLYMWGKQKAAIVDDNVLFFTQYHRGHVYPFPIGKGNLKAALDAIISDAEARGIPCRLTGVTEQEWQLLEQMYPGQFQLVEDRDAFDYVYDINDLADLKGKKFQKKRNHLHRFLDAYPDYQVEELTDAWVPAVEKMLENWYENRQKELPDMDFSMEKQAISRALKHREELQMEGILILWQGEILAMTMGSRLREDTFDIHFEKARADAEGAYPAINWAFARYLREKYPEVKYLNREDDMGLEGLRKAKKSYNPHHMVEKGWACLREDSCGQGS